MFLEESDREFATRDKLQSSEKLWGAAAHIIIAIAQQEGRRYNKHPHLEAAVLRLSRNPDNGVSVQDFKVAERLHVYFYHAQLSDTELTDYRRQVQTFVNRLLQIAT